MKKRNVSENEVYPGIKESSFRVLTKQDFVLVATSKPEIVKKILYHYKPRTTFIISPGNMDGTCTDKAGHCLPQKQIPEYNNKKISYGRRPLPMTSSGQKIATDCAGVLFRRGSRVKNWKRPSPTCCGLQ